MENWKTSRDHQEYFTSKKKKRLTVLRINKLIAKKVYYLTSLYKPQRSTMDNFNSFSYQYLRLENQTSSFK